MKITLTGSLGHISKPLAENLVHKGHDITVISSKPERQKEIEALGSKAAIGTMEDADFLSATFKVSMFSKLFKTKTNFSPLEFRQSFN
jgi:nucleoside-diphosphate-sugar epimerase